MIVQVTDVWKRYASSLRHGARYALLDSLRGLVGRGAPPPALRRHEFWSLRELSFQLEAGESLALVGRNGAGKTTLLKLLAGVIEPDRGELRVRGRTVALLLAGAGFHPLLSGRENLFIYGSLLGLSRAELEQRLPEIVDFAGLGEHLEMPVKHYSSGMYVRLAFAVAAHSRPRLLLVDEVLAVGDAGFRERCLNRLHQLRGEGTSLIVASHSAGQLRRLTDRALWLEQGRAVLSGPVGEVLARYADDVERRPAAPLGGTAADPPGAPVAPSRTARGWLQLDGAPLEDPTIPLAAGPHELRAGWELAAGTAPALRLRLERQGGRVASLLALLNPATLPPDGRLETRLAFESALPAAPTTLHLELGALASGSEPTSGSEAPALFGLAGLPGAVALGAPTPIPPGPSGVGAPLELRRVELTGDGTHLDPLLAPRGGPRLAWDLQGGPPGETFLEPGERLTLTLGLRCRGRLPGFRLLVGLASVDGSETGPESGFVCTLEQPRGPAEDCALCATLPVHLPAGPYRLRCALEARDEEGVWRRVELPEPLACRVLGPPPAGDARGVVELLELREERRPLGPDGSTAGPGAPSCPDDAARGTRARVVGLEPLPPQVEPGGALRVALTIAWAEAVEVPSFKLAWAAPDGVVAARLLHDPGRWPLAAVGAGETRRYELLVRPLLAPGPYELRVAACALEAGQRVVLDGRHQAAWCSLGTALRASPPGALSGTLWVLPAR